MKRMIQSAIALSFCLPVAFGACKEGCECDKCKEKAKEKTELAACKEGCECEKCKEKAKKQLA